MSAVVITRLEVMGSTIPEVYVKGIYGVKSIYNDGDGFSVIFNDSTVRFFNNAVPLKVDWEVSE